MVSICINLMYIVRQLPNSLAFLIDDNLRITIELCETKCYLTSCLLSFHCFSVPGISSSVISLVF